MPHFRCCVLLSAELLFVDVTDDDDGGGCSAKRAAAMLSLSEEVLVEAVVDVGASDVDGASPARKSGTLGMF